MNQILKTSISLGQFPTFRSVFFIVCAYLFINCSTKIIVKDNARENLIKEFTAHFIEKKTIEVNDTVFIVVKWQRDNSVKYTYFRNKLEITNKPTKCDYFQMNSNCVNFFDFEFSNSNEFRKVSFELTNGSTKNGYIKKEDGRMNYKVTSEMSR